jgi:hypothetical protein
MEKKGGGNFLRIALSVLGLALIAAAVVFYFRHGTPATLSLSPQSDKASYNTDFALKLTAKNSPLKSLSITATQEGKAFAVVQRTFNGSVMEHTEVFRLPRESGFKEGPIELTVESTVNSWLSMLGRGKSNLVVKLTL